MSGMHALTDGDRLAQCLCEDWHPVTFYIDMERREAATAALERLAEAERLLTRGQTLLANFIPDHDMLAWSLSVRDYFVPAAEPTYTVAFGASRKRGPKGEVLP